MSETYANTKKWLRRLGFVLLTEDEEQIIHTRFIEVKEVFDLTIKVGNDDFYCEFIVCTGLEVYDSISLRKDIERINRKTVFGKFIVGKDGELIYKYVLLLNPIGLDEAGFVASLDTVRISLKLFFHDLKESFERNRDTLQDFNISRSLN